MLRDQLLLPQPNSCGDRRPNSGTLLLAGACTYNKCNINISCLRTSCSWKPNGCGGDGRPNSGTLLLAGACAYENGNIYILSLGLKLKENTLNPYTGLSTSAPVQLQEGSQHWLFFAGRH